MLCFSAWGGPSQARNLQLRSKLHSEAHPSKVSTFWSAPPASTAQLMGYIFETLSKDHIKFFSRVLALKHNALNLHKDTLTHADQNQSFLKSLQHSNFPELSAWIGQNERDFQNVICAHVKEISET